MRRLVVVPGRSRRSGPETGALEVENMGAVVDTLIVEKGSALEAMIPALKALGHERVVAYGLPLKTNAVALTAHGPEGAGDPRSEGVAVKE